MDEKVSIELQMNQKTGIVAFISQSISDVDEIANISKQVTEFIDSNHPSRLIIDFERVKFFSSQVLGLLLDFRTRLAADNGEVVISAIDPQLHRVFRITNLDKIFRFFQDRESALKTTGKD